MDTVHIEISGVTALLAAYARGTGKQSDYKMNLSVCRCIYGSLASCFQQG